MRTQRRKLAGQLVKDEAERLGLRSKKQRAEAFKVSEATAARWLAGGMPDRALRHIEAVVEMPRYFLDYVIASDIPTIERLDMGDDLKQRAISKLKVFASGLADLEISNGDSQPDHETL